jgi:hypothetical protein
MLRIFELHNEDSRAEPPRQGQSIFWGLAVLYTVLCLVHLYGGWPELTTQLVGERVDGPSFLWLTWWGREALFQLHTNPFETQHLYYPWGMSLILTPFSVVNSLLGAPIDAFFGPVAAYNLVMIATYPLTGIAMYLLVHDLTGSRGAAIVAGTMAVFAPFRLSTVGWLNFAVTHWLLFFWWGMWRAFRHCSVRWGICAGVFAVLLLDSSYTLFLFAALSGFLAALTALLASGRRMGALLPAMASMVATILVLGAPIFYLMAQELARLGNYVAISFDTMIEGKPFSSFFVPGPVQLKQEPTAMRTSFLGYATLLAALTATVRFYRRPIALFWLAASGLFLVLSLGDHLNWSGPVSFPDGESVVPLPYHFLKELPVFDMLRVPHRFGVAGSLCLIVLAGIGLATWGEWLTPRVSPLFRGLAGTLLVGIVFLEFSVPLRSTHPRRTIPVLPVPGVFDEIAADERDMCVLHHPPPGFAGDSRVLSYLVRHGRPICIDGRAARENPIVRRRTRRSPLLWSMERAYREPQNLPLGGRAAQDARREGRLARVGWVVLSWESLEENQPQDWDRLHAFVEAVFPDAERRYWREEPEVRADLAEFRKTYPMLRWSTVFAVYRVSW